MPRNMRYRWMAERDFEVVSETGTRRTIQAGEPFRPSIVVTQGWPDRLSLQTADGTIWNVEPMVLAKHGMISNEDAPSSLHVVAGS